MIRGRLLDNEEREALAQRLESMKREVLDELAATANTDAPPEPWAGTGEVRTNADQAEAGREDELRFAEAEVDRVRLEAIEQALQRLANGRYGICASCGEEIARKRLQAQPAAIRCATCQATLEAHAPARR